MLRISTIALLVAMLVAIFAEPRLPAYARSYVGLDPVYRDSSFSRRMSIYYDRIVAQGQPEQIAFVGDSIVQGWNLGSIEGSINLGIGSEAARELTARLPRENLHNIDRWYLATGINDVGRGLSLEDVSELVEHLEQHFSEVDTLFWQHVLPTWSRHSPAEEEVRQAINSQITIACESMPNCTLVPVPETFEASVQDLTSDGVHPNALGYSLMTETALRVIN